MGRHESKPRASPECPEHRSPSGSRQVDGASCGDVCGELVQRCRGETDTKRSECLTQDPVDLDGGLPVLCSGQRTKDGTGVAASLLLDLGRHAAVG